MRASERPLIRRPLLGLGLAIGCVILALGISIFFRDSRTLLDYERLSQELPSDPNTDDGSDTNGAVSLAERSTLPRGAVAWVTVQGTSIDLPVADGTQGNTWYLTHDLWGNASELGCPFMDHRCTSPDDTHVLVYGHHLSLTNAMFSPLHLCFRQREFERLGPCVWRTSQDTTRFKPLCALSVDEHFQAIMRFSFSDDTELRDWLRSMIDASEAKSPTASALVNGAHRVLTLVTCSSNLAGQPWRTLVLFVR